MNYDNYDYAIVEKYKVRLLWPSNCNNGIVANPSKLNVDDLRILYRELEVGTCRWVEVDGKELAGRKTQPNINNPPATTTATNPPASKLKRKQRSDKGVTRGPRKRPRTSENDDPSPSTSHTQQKRRKQAPKSAEIVDDAADDDNE
ncbi:hypothetical protein K435DRAFT_669600 [Dendrothele bispora CBS 962.96]|uniref:Uncharacterized protein n=1 Tax=Dendrothele bispora (strain CBS 962.96) TaxID=1314807 RepID=A0A4V4HF63_DENBC|nr:hypothetical protein K435DRAFT_669600 [Dendrothele bispora CBS 962.96]